MKYLFLFAALVAAASAGSLQAAFTAAFNARVSDRTWANTFGNVEGLYAEDQCAGPSAKWPYPPRILFSDLDWALRNGVFRCGYNANSSYLSNDGQVLLQTTSNSATGLVVDFWNALASDVANHYNVPDFSVTWTTSFASSTDTLNAVISGEIDAACGRWTAGADVKVGDAHYPRFQVLSLMPCVTYTTLPTVYTLVGSSITSFWDLVNYPGNLTVCTVGTPGGGTEQSCTSTINQYSDRPNFHCSGVLNNAFPYLVDGLCDAVWEGYPTVGTIDEYNAFPAPVLSGASTFFRLD